ncbi:MULTISPECIES: class I SAM-dependent RNA methyltransferase [unclassified Treponema]|uniref:class I SAM-dependent RNA methyltransferase n=1 Tax=unclassified Treponema TaxID=2638727 RepID=UPI0020A3ABD8|nr:MULTISPECIES: RsmD family RNA methyltransferase [unclassified Treponema]UTC66388.1 class I SAM-dependent RNA methyltransferase [Treponema sp. OMZ 789]UTC69118.1 class I SAM-dependent RNA methyltransferase [Treponema sp. OMZ 790]UTC71830.1 class I SAM-dependent RNA methyltransferase [Treponema sp. OMZ 791]
MQKEIVKTKKMVFGASCIADLKDGKTVFVPYSLPDEVLEISIVKEHKNYTEGKIEKILESSPHRVEPKCPHFYACGGCNLQTADDGYQHLLRKSMALEALDRALSSNFNSTIGKSKTENPFFEKSILENSIFVSGPDWEYRSRFQFYVDKDGSLSLKENKNSDSVKIKDCPVAVPAIRNLLKSDLKEYAPNSRIHIFSDGEKIFTEKNAKDCEVGLAGKRIKFNPLGFFQSNLKMTEKLINTIFEHSRISGRVLDFYSGVGTFSLFAYDKAKEIHLVEHNKHALSYAKENFKINKESKIFYHNLDGKNWAKTKESKLKFDTVFIDPPRSGIDKEALSWLCSSGTCQIFYISCDPVTFARDTAKLLLSGYKLEQHFLFDFYPQTHHIETLGIFRKLGMI